MAPGNTIATTSTLGKTPTAQSLLAAKLAEATVSDTAGERGASALTSSQRKNRRRREKRLEIARASKTAVRSTPLLGTHAPLPASTATRKRPTESKPKRTETVHDICTVENSSPETSPKRLASAARQQALLVPPTVAGGNEFMYMLTRLQGWMRDGMKANMLTSSPSFADMKESTAVGEALAQPEPATVPRETAPTDAVATPPSAGAQAVAEVVSPAVLHLLSGLQQQIAAQTQQSAQALQQTGAQILALNHQLSRYHSVISLHEMTIQTLQADVARQTGVASTMSAQNLDLARQNLDLANQVEQLKVHNDTLCSTNMGLQIDEQAIKRARTDTENRAAEVNKKRQAAIDQRLADHIAIARNGAKALCLEVSEDSLRDAAMKAISMEDSQKPASTSAAEAPTEAVTPAAVAPAPASIPAKVVVPQQAAAPILTQAQTAANIKASKQVLTTSYAAAAQTRAVEQHCHAPAAAPCNHNHPLSAAEAESDLDSRQKAIHDERLQLRIAKKKECFSDYLKEFEQNGGIDIVLQQQPLMQGGNHQLNDSNAWNPQNQLPFMSSAELQQQQIRLQQYQHFHYQQQQLPHANIQQQQGPNLQQQQLNPPSQQNAAYQQNHRNQGEVSRVVADAEDGNTDDDDAMIQDSRDAGRARASPPEKFNGTTKVEVFLSEFENYLIQCGAKKNSWTGLAQSYLLGTAQSTWMHAKSTLVAPYSWDTFCSVLKTQYGVHDPERVARFALRALRQGTTTALAYDNAFRAILSEIPNTDPHTIIDQYLTGLREDIRIECSYNKLTDTKWTTFNEVSKKVLLHTGSTSFPGSQPNQNPRPSVSSVHPQNLTGKKRTRERSTTPQVAATQESSKRQAPYNGPGIINGQRPPAGYNATTGLGPDMPIMPNTAETIAHYHKLGKTQNDYEWHSALHAWNGHARMHGLCQYCGEARHVSTGCPIKLQGLKDRYVIYPKIEKKWKGPARMGRRGL